MSEDNPTREPIPTTNRGIEALIRESGEEARQAPLPSGTQPRTIEYPKDPRLLKEYFRNMVRMSLEEETTGQRTPYKKRHGTAIRLAENKVALEEAEARVAETEIDETTGLLSKDATFRKLREMLDQASRSGIPITGLVLDLNNLKTINDLQGHSEGDVRLKKISTTISEHLRTVDIAGRIGGNELLVLLYDTVPEDAVPHWERINTVLEAAGIRVSAGAAELHSIPGMDPQTIIMEADAAMYVSKLKSKQTLSQPELVLFNNLSPQQKGNLAEIKRNAEARSTKLAG